MMKRILVVFFGLVAAIISTAQPLPGDQAFKLTTRIIDSTTVMVQWKAHAGYFLYRNHFKFSVDKPEKAQLGMVLLPQGEHLRNQIDIPVPILGLQAGKVNLKVAYQGCADDGFCYPPSTQLVQLTINDKLALTNAHIITPPSSKVKLSTTDKAKQILQHDTLLFVLLSFFGFGLLLAFTPCVLPMIPVLSGIIVGHGPNLTSKKAFMLSLIYVLSMSFTYALVGVLVALLGHNFQIIFQQPLFIILFSFVFVLLALSMFGFYDLKLPESWQSKFAHLSQNQHHGAYLGVAVMGMLSTLILSPCVTAPLVGALGYIASTGNALLGGIALFTLGLGMGTPLLIVGASAGKLLPKAGAWMNAVKSIFGVMLLAVAIYLLERIIPGQISLLLWAALLIITGLYLGALKRNQASQWHKLWQGLGIMMLIYGGMMVVGAGMGNSDPLNPIGSLMSQRQTQTFKNNGLSYQPVKSLSDVKRFLTQARTNGKQVLLDFYADWCVACKAMDRTTFQDPAVKDALKNYLILRADVTANDSTDQALENYYGVIAPPTILLFDAQGNELKHARIVGEMGAEEFIRSLPQAR